MTRVGLDLRRRGEGERGGGGSSWCGLFLATDQEELCKVRLRYVARGNTCILRARCVNLAMRTEAKTRTRSVAPAYSSFLRPHRPSGVCLVVVVVVVVPGVGSATWKLTKSNTRWRPSDPMSPTNRQLNRSLSFCANTIDWLH